MRLSVSSASVFACMSKACAPPPAGKGGSLPRAHGSAPSPDQIEKKMLGRDTAFDRFVFREAQGLQTKDLAMVPATKMTANSRVMDHLLKDEGFKKWVEEQDLSSVRRSDIAEEVKKVIDQWAINAVDPVSAFTMAQHRAAATVHGASDAWKKMEGIIPSSVKPYVDEMYKSKGPLFEAIVRSEYKATQEWFAQHGIKEVVLHRGMALDHGSKTGDVVNAQMYPLSSWTEYFGEAKHFSKTYGDKTKKSIVLSTRVPVEMIQSIPLTGRGCLLEYEFVLIGKPTEALVSFDGSDA